MTRNELHEILKIPFSKRHSQGLQTFEWEHCCKKFYKIPNYLAIKHMMELFEYICKESDDSIILQCEYGLDTYYFGVGLSDCDNLILKELRELYNNATWYVDTWAD